LTINELLLAYWNDYEKYRPRHPSGSKGEYYCVQSALRPLKELYGHTRVADFGVLALKAVRDRMIATTTKAGRPWSRKFINACITRIKAVFRWGIENQVIEGTDVIARLTAVDAVRPLQRFRTTAREADGVKPVPIDVVQATLPYAPTPVAAMIRLQLL